MVYDYDVLERCYLEVYKGALFAYATNKTEIYKNTYIESGRNVLIRCSTGFVMVNPDSQKATQTLRCLRGKWTETGQCVPGKILMLKRYRHRILLKLIKLDVSKGIFCLIILF